MTPDAQFSLRSQKYILKGIDTTTTYSWGATIAVRNISLKELIHYLGWPFDYTIGCQKYILKGIDTYVGKVGYAIDKSQKYILKGIDTIRRRQNSQKINSQKYILKGIDTKIKKRKKKTSGLVRNISLKELIQMLRHCKLITQLFV